MNNQQNNTITIGATDLSFHRVTASIITHVLRNMGFVVNRIFATHTDTFDKLKSGDIDMLVSAWLPFNDGKFKTDIEKTISLIELGRHYKPYSFWGVPDYIPAEDVSELSDLLKPHVKKRMRPVIQGICPGAGISRFSMDTMEVYNLKKSGYKFFTGTEECCFNTIEQAIKNKEWVVIPFWKPNYLHLKYNIRELKDPKGILGKPDKAVLMLREDKKKLFSEEQIKMLDSLQFSNKIIEGLDYLVAQSGDDVDEITLDWLSITKTILF